MIGCFIVLANVDMNDFLRCLVLILLYAALDEKHWVAWPIIFPCVCYCWWEVLIWACQFGHDFPWWFIVRDAFGMVWSLCAKGKMPFNFSYSEHRFLMCVSSFHPHPRKCQHNSNPAYNSEWCRNIIANSHTMSFFVRGALAEIPVYGGLIIVKFGNPWCSLSDLSSPPPSHLNGVIVHACKVM